MLLITKDNITEQGTRFKFTKFIECVAILQAFDLAIFGSTISEYIWRCAAHCLPWKKISSLETLVQDRDVYINNINTYCFKPDIPRDKLIQFFGKIATVHENSFVFKAINVFELTLGFNNPFEDAPYFLTLEFANASTNNLWAWEDLLTTVALHKEQFVVFKSTASVRYLLEHQWPSLHVQDFGDVQMWGVIQRIAKKILSNETTILINNPEFYLESGIQRMYALASKGYTVTWRCKGIRVVLPQNTLEDKCAICLEYECARNRFQGEVTLPCEHKYHASCVATLAQKATMVAKCPLCRATFPAKLLKLL